MWLYAEYSCTRKLAVSDVSLQVIVLPPVAPASFGKMSYRYRLTVEALPTADARKTIPEGSPPAAVPRDVSEAKNPTKTPLSVGEMLEAEVVAALALVSEPTNLSLSVARL
jgi:hypothetical protein